MTESATAHIPILLRPIVDALIEPFCALSEPAWLVDCTLGGGGHTAAFLNAFSANPNLQRHRVLAVDQDLQAIERAKRRFEVELAEGRLEIVHSRFGDIQTVLADRKVFGMMADLGFSSDQINDPSRGLSFQSEGPLDMRLDQSRGPSCAEYLARVTESELADVLWVYGEERYSRRIAAAVIRARMEGRLPATTRELTDLIVRAVPPAARYGRIHAATRSFQALRILINNELEELDNLLGRVILSVQPGGRIAILSFHSLEDRKVKRAFRGVPGEANAFRSLTKKPIEADEDELKANPRARSAKLRIAERI